MLSRLAMSYGAELGRVDGWALVFYSWCWLVDLCFL